MARGYLIILLHAHLPYVHHPEHRRFFEETWLFEAITESYIPLIRVFEKLVRDRVPFRITLSLSPTLLTMLQSRLLRQRYVRHLERLTALAEKEIRRTRRQPALNGLARWYRRFFSETLRLFNGRYKKNLLEPLKKLERAGCLELITTSATHAFLPLLKLHPSSVRAQMLTGAACFRAAFGSDAPGVWLPECGYYPGLEAMLQEAGYRYFFLDTHGILHADPQPRHGSAAPVACPNGVAAFGRDRESSKQVWSAREGYPGDFSYREYYRDIGFELDPAALDPFSPEGARAPTGIKYYRITGRHDDKEYYDPEAARARAALHADHFLSCRHQEIEAASRSMDRPPVVVAPFDAELFGHWWFEGPQWLDGLIRRIASGQGDIVLATASDYLAAHPVLQTAAPSGSSWGFEGYNDFWLNSANDWIYPYLHSASGQMERLALRRARRGSPADRALKQAARSLLLAQASDWPFILKTGTAIEYARGRIRDALARFHYLAGAIEASAVDERRLRALEIMDDIFPDISYRDFAPHTPEGG